MLQQIESKLLQESDVETQGRFSVAPDLTVVKNLVGYEGVSEKIEPVWGDRLAIYHPATSNITFLNAPMWRLFDAVSDGNGTSIEIAASTGFAPEVIDEAIVSLKTEGIVLDSTEDDTRKVIAFGKSYLEDEEIFLSLTELCNMGCLNCSTAVDIIPAGEARTMDSETLEMGLTQIVRSSVEKDKKHLRLKWAGGEPLLPKFRPLLRAGQDTISRLSKEFPALEISQVILTNGTHLGVDVVAELKEWKVDASVSLWGIGEGNDRMRGVRREQDKYIHIIEGVKRLHEAGVPYNIHYVVTPYNPEQFAEMVTTMWDTQSEQFIGRNWNWKENEKRSLPVGIGFWRAQSQEEQALMNQKGYSKMVGGLRLGFAVYSDLIKKGVQVPTLGTIDYLNLYEGVKPTSCGSFFNYVAFGASGVAPCHEELYGMEPNIDQVRKGANIIELANAGIKGRQSNLLGINIEYPGIDPRVSIVLALHGGAACPRPGLQQSDGHLLKAAPTVAGLYVPILDELIALETQRRLYAVENTVPPAHLELRKVRALPMFGMRASWSQACSSAL